MIVGLRTGYSGAQSIEDDSQNVGFELIQFFEPGIKNIKSCFADPCHQDSPVNQGAKNESICQLDDG